MLFRSPFEFTAAAVRSIQYPLPETLPNPQGEYCFELLGNDTLYGDLVSLDAESLVLHGQSLGRISIERSQVRRFYRWQGGAQLLFLGPDGLAGWNQLENPKAWADEGGQPATKKPNAAIWRNFTLPDKCIIDFEVAWNAKADFTLAVGVPADKNLARDAFRFEVWDNQLVAHREVSNAADLIPLMPVENGPGRAHFVAYLDLYTDDAKKARPIAAKYADHPVDRWRDAFRAIQAQLDEIEGKGPAVVNPEDRTQQQTQLAASEPSLDFQVEAKQLSIRYQNLTAVKVNYYLMDVELLFSHNPFVQQYTGQFSSIKPNQSVELQLPAKQNAMKAPMPEALHNKNVLIEITGGGQTKTQAYYSHSLAVQLVENFGQLKVAHAETGKTIPKAYVKVYAQLPNGQVRFYKDGYTDLRGRFDYASLNTNEIEQVQKFSILVLTEDAGALVREAMPPKR